MTALLFVLGPSVSLGQLELDAYPGAVGQEFDYRSTPDNLNLAPPASSPAPPVTPVRPNPFAKPIPYTPPANMPRQVRNVLDRYPGATSQYVLSQLNERPSSGVPVSATATTTGYPSVRSQAKPFQSGYSPQGTISPYMNLFRDEDATELPNYYMFVRPQMEQQSINRNQQAELSRLHRQVQTVGTTRTTGFSGSATPTGHGTRFLNTAQYYGSFGTTR
jgi:hypothetical protein